MRRRLCWRRWLVALCFAGFALTASGCASSGGAAHDDDYLKYVWVEVPGNERVALRWHEREMPLKVHLTPPPAEISNDPQAVYDVVRDGIVDWTDTAGPGLPRFTFVDDPGQADIPIVWEAEPGGDWYGAYCWYDINYMTRRFGVARILVTTHTRDGSALPLDKLYVLMLHEMGHAIGLTGHSPDPQDVMYHGWLTASGLSDRDRETVRGIYARPVGSRVVGARTADR